MFVCLRYRHLLFRLAFRSKRGVLDSVSVSVAQPFHLAGQGAAQSKADFADRRHWQLCQQAPPIRRSFRCFIAIRRPLFCGVLMLNAPARAKSGRPSSPRSANRVIRVPKPSRRNTEHEHSGALARLIRDSRALMLVPDVTVVAGSLTP